MTCCPGCVALADRVAELERRVTALVERESLRAGVVPMIQADLGLGLAPAPAAAKRGRVRARPIVEAAQRIWAYQNSVRRAVMPRALDLRWTPAACDRVVKILEAGHTEEDCRGVLDSIADRCRTDERQREWFDGITNWRPDNFERHLGRVGIKTTQKGALSVLAAEMEDMRDE